MNFDAASVSGIKQHMDAVTQPPTLFVRLSPGKTVPLFSQKFYPEFCSYTILLFLLFVPFLFIIFMYNIMI